VNTNLHIIITGASGFIGEALLKYFWLKGYELTALVRTIPNEELIGVKYVLYDMAKEIDKSVSFQNAVIIHCAYSKQNESLTFDINQRAAQNLLQKVKREQAKHCVFFSSFSATSASESYYATQKNKLEKLFQLANTCIVRPGLVVGNGGLFFSTLQFIKRFGVLPLMGGGSQLVHYVGIKDVVKAIEEIIVQSRLGCFYLNHPLPLNYKTFYKTVAKKINKRLLLVPVPLWLIKLLLYLYAYLPNASITKDNIKGLNQVPTPDAAIMKQSVFSFSFKDLDSIEI
jgi:NAD dependent epimerase/dehydratase family enzyme